MKTLKKRAIPLKVAELVYGEDTGDLHPGIITEIVLELISKELNVSRGMSAKILDDFISGV